jgi:hypothetical protein
MEDPSKAASSAVTGLRRGGHRAPRECYAVARISKMASRAI